MVLGAGVGVTFGNVALGAGLGLVLGAALKAYFGTASSKNSKTQDGNDG